MKILVTGADGFIGKNLCVSLAEQAGFEVLPVVRATDPAALESKVAQADAVIHLAGVNRPQDPAEFEKNCVGMRKMADPAEVKKMEQALKELEAAAAEIEAEAKAE